MTLPCINAIDHRLADSRAWFEVIGVLTEPHQARSRGQGVKVPVTLFEFIAWVHRTLLRHRSRVPALVRVAVTLLNASATGWHVLE